MSLKYQKISLFDVPKGSILVHAVNAQGVWGSGIAVEFKKRFPKSFQEYNSYCRYHDEPHNLPCFITPEENGYKIGCLITSKNYAAKVDEPWEILKRTSNAFNMMIERYPEIVNIPIYSNKFNSGLFKVPWTDTEKLLKEFVDKYNIDWTVCDPNL